MADKFICHHIHNSHVFPNYLLIFPTITSGQSFSVWSSCWMVSEASAVRIWTLKLFNWTDWKLFSFTLPFTCDFAATATYILPMACHCMTLLHHWQVGKQLLPTAVMICVQCAVMEATSNCAMNALEHFIQVVLSCLTSQLLSFMSLLHYFPSSACKCSCYKKLSRISWK